MRERRGGEGFFDSQKMKAPCNPHFACLYSSLLFILQLNLPHFPFLSHTLPPITPLHRVRPSRWAGFVWVPGSCEALPSDEEVWTMGLRWIGLATPNVSLTHRVNNARGEKNKHTEGSRWEGQHGQHQFVLERQEGGSDSFGVDITSLCRFAS